MDQNATLSTMDETKSFLLERAARRHQVPEEKRPESVAQRLSRLLAQLPTPPEPSPLHD